MPASARPLSKRGHPLYPVSIATKHFSTVSLNGLSDYRRVLVTLSRPGFQSIGLRSHLCKSHQSPIRIKAVRIVMNHDFPYAPGYFCSPRKRLVPYRVQWIETDLVALHQPLGGSRHGRFIN